MHNMQCILYRNKTRVCQLHTAGGKLQPLFGSVFSKCFTKLKFIVFVEFASLRMSTKILVWHGSLLFYKIGRRIVSNRCMCVLKHTSVCAPGLKSKCLGLCDLLYKTGWKDRGHPLPSLLLYIPCCISLAWFLEQAFDSHQFWILSLAEAEHGKVWFGFLNSAEAADWGQHCEFCVEQPQSA